MPTLNDATDELGFPTRRDSVSDSPKTASLFTLPKCFKHRIKFRHPGYPDNHNILLSLCGVDHPDGGIHHETARIACAIVANNRWDGFLSEKHCGLGINIPRNGIIRGQGYYFQVPNINDSMKPVAEMSSGRNLIYARRRNQSSLCSRPSV